MGMVGASGARGGALLRAAVLTSAGLVAVWWLAGSLLPELLAEQWDCDLGWRCLGEPGAPSVLLALGVLLLVASVVPAAAVVAGLLLVVGTLVRRRLGRTGSTLVVLPAALVGALVVALVVAGVAIAVS